MQKHCVIIWPVPIVWIVNRDTERCFLMRKIVLSILTAVCCCVGFLGVGASTATADTTGDIYIDGIRVSVFSVPIATHDDLNAFLASDTPKDVEVAADGTVLSVTETTKEALLNKYVPNWRTRIDISVGACSPGDMCISSIYGGNYAARNIGTRYVNYPNTSGIFSGKWTCEAWSGNVSFAGRLGPWSGQFLPPGQKVAISKIAIYG